MNRVYERLHPVVREYIYNQEWESLRPVQEAAAAGILGEEGHLIIAAGTASGKTEACFFPVISILAEKRRNSVGALYISPLKALINDQFSRLELLAHEAEIPLWRWHGDIPGRHKEKLLERPAGILQITPESLEALLLRQPNRIAVLFRELSFVVIDEVHAFMGTGRGQQLLCQLARIERSLGSLSSSFPRRIGLSATLADYRRAMEWITRGSRLGREAALIEEEKSRRRVRIALDYFSRNKGEEQDYYQSLYRETRGKRCIIFTNSRLDAEETAGALRSIGGGESRFLIHHGSISAALRGEAEKELREAAGPITLAATATLEMGIDIGALDRVIQLGPPLSVSAFVQRLGRSGRRSGTSEIYFSSLAGSNDALDMPWGLLKTIAVIELYIKEKWIEDRPEPPLPYSLLIHESLSLTASWGEKKPELLEKEVLSLPGFEQVSGEDYRRILEALIRAGLLEQTAEGTLIIGLEGERITGHYSFYSVFSNDTEYRVIHGAMEIGKVNFAPPVGSGIVLGGRYWRVLRSDQRQREIAVEPGTEGALRLWRGGGVENHPRVSAKILEILLSRESYTYLSAGAAKCLKEARDTAENFGFGGKGWSLIETDGDSQGPYTSFRILPWLGSRGMRTLLLILQDEETALVLGIIALLRESDYSIFVSSKLPLQIFREKLFGIIENLNSASLETLAAKSVDTIPCTEKFDLWLPPSLLAKQYAANMLDPEELKESV
ncbi:MAG: DEAD/DEAH box helicase [Treponema sp.]|jgi:ATP-dependent Lhr-like helicase|nr:DEAD/DEAH box helicase [Treponema sp.]